MPMWALVSKAFSHPSSQALKTLLSASFPANKALVPPGRLQSCRSTTSPRNPTPTHSPSSPPMPPLMWVKEKLPLTDEKHWSPSNILSSSVGDGGGGCLCATKPESMGHQCSRQQPLSLGGHSFMSACLFLYFKTKMSHILYRASHGFSPCVLYVIDSFTQVSLCIIYHFSVCFF